MTAQADNGGALERHPLIGLVTRVLDLGAAVVMFAMMVLSFADVFAREVLNEPFPFTLDVIRLMLPAMIYAVLPVISRNEQHVCVDLLDRWIPSSWVRPRQLAINLLACAIFAFMSWQIWLHAHEKIEFHEVTSHMEWPLSPIYFLMSVLAAVTAAGLALNFYAYLFGRTPPRDKIGAAAFE